MSEKLLPCPFCGSDSVCIAGKIGLTKIVCNRCEALVSKPLFEDAIKAWNTRSTHKLKGAQNELKGGDEKCVTLKDAPTSPAPEVTKGAQFSDTEKGEE